MRFVHEKIYVMQCFCRNPRQKYLVFFFFSTRITCKFYTGIPNEKKFQKILFGCWMTSRFHVFDTRSLPPPVSLDFCRQSCVVVFLVDGGPLIWKFREEKAGEIFVAGKLSKLAEKRPPHQQQEKKKSEKGGRSQENAAQGAAAGKVQTMAPSRPALALPHPLSGQPIHSFMLFWQLSLEPGPIFFGSDKTRATTCLRPPPLELVLLGNDRTNHSKWKSEP